MPNRRLQGHQKGTKMPPMAAQPITIQTYHSGRWHDAATLTFQSGSTRVAYLNEYLEAEIDSFLKTDERAIAEAYPLDFEIWTAKGWPAFVLDIMPSGAARRWWTRQLGLQDLTDKDLEHKLLREYTSAPIGHLRVKESVRDYQVPIPFTKDEVIGRDTSFLAYAAEHGAAFGGATGAGGDAPKVLLVEDAAGHVYPEGALKDHDVVKSWLVKWPRGKSTARDHLVLETEHIYSQALAALDLNILPGELHAPESGKPSLWFPRFDRINTEGGMNRLAVESFYSLAGINVPGAVATHETFLQAISDALERRGQHHQMKGIATEIVRRDLLNVVLGNSDNHGRNSAVFRGKDLVLAPIFDLAPMVMDPEGVTRSTRWKEAERGGNIAWNGVMESVSRWISEEELRSSLKDFAKDLLALPDELRDLGLSDEVLNFPRVYLRDLPSTLKNWGIL